MSRSAHLSLLRRRSVGLGLMSGLLIGSFSLIKAGAIYSQGAAAPETTPLFAPEPLPPVDGTPANTVEKISLTAIPPRLGDDGSLLIKPGEKIQATLKVRNVSTVPVRIESQVLDFVLAEDGETPMAVSDAVSNRWSLASWVVLSPTSQVLQPNQLGQVNVLIEAPANALPGGHYAMVLHRPTAVKTVAGVDNGAAPASAISQEVGSLLYVTVDGPINMAAFLRNFTFPAVTEYGPVPFNLTVENNSDIHIKPQITVEITNWFGQEVARIPLEGKNVFPLSSRDFSGQWERVWGIGRYQARAVMSFGDEGNVTVARTAFWLWPYKLVVLGGGVTLAVLLVLGVVYRHWRHRRQLNHRKMKLLEAKVAELEAAASRPMVSSSPSSKK